MKLHPSKFLFHVGKAAAKIGRLLALPGERLQEWGEELWDENCSCPFCEKQRSKIGIH